MPFEHSRGRKPLAAAFDSQDPLAEGVERFDPEFAVTAIQLPNNALFHLVRGFTREREREDVADLEVVVLNEVNTLPGFTAYSRYPRMMAAAGLDLTDVIERCLAAALGR